MLGVFLTFVSSLALIDSFNLVPVNQVLTITGTVPAEKHNEYVRRASSRSGN